MTLKQITTLIALLAIPSSLLSMNLAQERISTWPEQLYHNAYQGAQRYYSFGKEEYERAVACAMTATKEQADQEQWPEEFRVVCDWIYALKKTEEVYLSQPYKPWTIDDLKTISSWLTRLTTEEPGVFRKALAHWEVQALSDKERVLACLIQLKEYLQRFTSYQDFITAKSEGDKVKWKRLVTMASPEALELVEGCKPDLKGTINQTNIAGYLSEPISTNEKIVLKQSFIVFPPAEGIEPQLSQYLENQNKNMDELYKVTLNPELKRRCIIELGAICHLELVRIHSFAEGSKRLGRLCMNIMCMQQGIEPIIIDSAADYGERLMASLIQHANEPFVNYILSISASKQDSTEHTRPQPKQETRSCANCKKENAPQRCSRCKAVNYCNRECQKHHWKIHKKNCKK